MKNSAYRVRSIGILAAILFVAGCAGNQPIITASPAPNTPSPAHTANTKNPANAATAANIPHVAKAKAKATPSAAQATLEAGVDLYNHGEYAAAIKRLRSAPEIWKADKPLQLEALKYMAFSYCVSGRKTLCRQQFQKALKLDPAFDLAPGEKGHPLWGPVFDAVKK